MHDLSIDWAALHSAFQMNMPEVRCFLCSDDGRVLKLPPGDASLPAVRSEPARYLSIEAIPSRIQYQWLDDFIRDVEDVDIKARMEAAINGKGAFRRFKDILLSSPEERRRWFEYRDQMMRQRIVEWVREQGIVPSNEPPWLAEDALAQTAQTPAGPVLDEPATHIAAPPPIRAQTPINEDNVGNVLHGHSPQAVPRKMGVRNSAHDVEALRDFLIEWSDDRNRKQAAISQQSPLELEELATEIGRHFQVRSGHL